MSRFRTVLDKSRDFHDRGWSANGHGWTIYGYGYDLFWHDDDGFNDILMFFADFNPELAKFIHQAATSRACQTIIFGTGVLAQDTHPNGPRGAGVPPGDRTGGETPPALAAGDGCATWASVQKPERTMLPSRRDFCI
jgi:hypothetical protein